MIRGRILLIVAPILAPALASCSRSDAPPLYSVRGKVMYKGQPAAGAMVMLRREDPAPGTTPLVPTGQADEDGSFSLAVDQVGDGAPAGKYAALIQWRTRVEGQERPKEAPKKGRRYVVPPRPDGVPDRLEGRFMNADTTPFHVEVKPGENNLELFDVSKEPPKPAAVRQPNRSVSD